jgi:hypothetical protein
MTDPRRRRATAESASFVFQISRTTLTRAGLKLYSFTTCAPALRNYKALYFDILRSLQERQEVIVDSENLRGSKNFGIVGHTIPTAHMRPQTASAGF